MKKKIRVLFFCKHNSCRSQMAQAYLKHDGENEYQVFRAGLDPKPIHPLVGEVMEEEGLSIEGQTSNGVDMYLGKQPFDSAIMVCREGEAECPKLYPFAMKLERWDLPDPAEVAGDHADILEVFRRTRDENNVRLQKWLTYNNF